MEEYELELVREHKVVKSNDLIQKAKYDLTATQQKFLAYCVSKIKPSNAEVPELEITVSDFCQVCGINVRGFYQEFREMIDGFDDRRIWIDTGEEAFKLFWFSDVTYRYGEGVVKVEFSKRMNKYLVGLSKRFTAYELINILALRSKYAIRIFELLKSYDYRNVIEFKTDDLKRLLYIENNYPNFADFRRFVLVPALKEINEYTELTVTTEEKRRGNKIASVVFHIEGKGLKERLDCYRRAEYLLDGQNLDQVSLFDRGAHDGDD